MMKALPLFFLLLLVSLDSHAQLIVSPPNSGAAIDSLIRNVLADESIDVQSVSFQGAAEAMGVFSASNDFPLSGGIIMSTGMVTDAPIGGSTGNGTNFNLMGDFDIESFLPGIPSRDAFAITMDFIPLGEELALEYLFASNDYGLYECSQYTDAPGFFLSGPGINGPFSNNAINLATVPNKPDVPVCINTINAGQVGPNGEASACFNFDPDWSANNIYYSGSDNLLSFAGRTVVLSALSASVVPGETYTLKLVIADASDGLFDSAIFLKGGGLSSDDEIISETITIDTLLCGVFPITLPNGALYDDYSIGLNTDTINFINGLDTVTYILNITALEEPVTELMVALCAGEIIEIDGTSINQPGEYTFIYPTTFCDSTVIYTIDYLEESITYLYDTTCVLDQVGIYNMLYTAANGCDSTVILEVTLAESLAAINFENYNACEGDTLLLEGQSYTSDTTWQELIIAGGSANGCDSIRKVRIRFTNHDFVTLQSIPEAICEGDTLEIIYGEDFTSEYQVSMIETQGDSLPLPDGIGVAYVSTIDINSFPSGSTITDTDITTFKVCINIEHSWAWDLDIFLTCPNGTSILLVNQEFIATEVFLGEPFEDDEGIPIVPGIGYTYCWTAGSTHTWQEYADEFAVSTLPEGDYASFEDLENLIGCPWNGSWELTVIDLWGVDNGFIFNWSIGQEIIQGLDTALVVSQGWLDHPDAQIMGDTLQFIASEAGQYDFTYALQDSLGCVYDTTFLVLVETPTFQEFDISLCTGAILEGLSVDTSGTYTFVYPSIGGCDSTLVYHVTITGEIDTTFTFTQSCRIDSIGVFETIYTTPIGCDSVVIQTVEYIPPVDTTLGLVVYTCDQALAGLSYETYLNVEGCDSIVLTEIIYEDLGLSSTIVGDTCEQGIGSITLDVANPAIWSEISLNWLDENGDIVDTGLVANQLSEGLYLVTGSLGDFCSIEEMFQVTNMGLNDVSAAFSFINTDESFIFTIDDPDPNTTYEWELGDGTVTADVSNLIHEYELPGGYQVDVTAQNNCGEDQFTVIAFDTPTISMPDQQGLIGETLLVPVIINGAYQAASVNVNLQFDSPSGSGTEFGIMDIYPTTLEGQGTFSWFPIAINEIGISWSANFPGVTLQDGDTLFVLELFLFNPGVVPSILDDSEISFYTQDLVLAPIPFNAENGEIIIENGFSAMGDVVLAPYHEQAFQGLPGVEVFFNAAGSSSIQETGSLGNYFAENLIPGSDYQVSFSRPGNADNGLSTLGILRLLRHLANIDPITSPYQLIAADADCNEIVEIDDVFTIQDAILNFGGEESEDCPSWKFVEADYVFPDPTDPFGYPEVFSLNANEPLLDLGTTYGIKNGDVLGISDPDFRPIQTDTLYLLANNGAYSSGETVTIDFKVAGFDQLTGFQLELNFDVLALEFQGIEIGSIPGFDSTNFGLTQTDNGRIRANWFVSDLMPVSLEDNELAFSISFTAQSDIVDVSEALMLSMSDKFPPEAYDASFVPLPLQLSFDVIDAVSETIYSGLALYQNVPNPFGEQTQISFYLPEAMDITLIITDAMGRRIHQFRGSYGQGHQSINWMLEGRLSAGVYQYSLLTDQGQLSKRMVLVK